MADAPKPAKIATFGVRSNPTTTSSWSTQTTCDAGFDAPRRAQPRRRISRFESSSACRTAPFCTSAGAAFDLGADGGKGTLIKLAALHGRAGAHLRPVRELGARRVDRRRRRSLRRRARSTCCWSTTRPACWRWPQRQARGLNITTADNGLMAISAALKSEPDLLLTVEIPEMDGSTLAADGRAAQEARPPADRVPDRAVRRHVAASRVAIAWGSTTTCRRTCRRTRSSPVCKAWWPAARGSAPSRTAACAVTCSTSASAAVAIVPPRPRKKTGDLQAEERPGQRGAAARAGRAARRQELGSATQGSSAIDRKCSTHAGLGRRSSSSSSLLEPRELGDPSARAAVGDLPADGARPPRRTRPTRACGASGCSPASPARSTRIFETRSPGTGPPEQVLEGMSFGTGPEKIRARRGVGGRSGARAVQRAGLPLPDLLAALGAVQIGGAGGVGDVALAREIGPPRC